MINMLKKDKEFKEAIGAFIIAFSEFEFGLVFLCTMTEFNLLNKNSYIKKYMGFEFSKKMDHLTQFIDEYLPEIKSIWDNIKQEIGQLNRERKFLVHGHMAYGLPNETITTYIRQNNKVITGNSQVIPKNQTVSEIEGFTNRLHHLNTGENGINGEFHTFFTKTRINKWNKLVSDENKILYRVNAETVSEWKGRVSDQ